MAALNELNDLINKIIIEKMRKFSTEKDIYNRPLLKSKHLLEGLSKQIFLQVEELSRLTDKSSTYYNQKLAHLIFTLERIQTDCAQAGLDTENTQNLTHAINNLRCTLQSDKYITRFSYDQRDSIVELLEYRQEEIGKGMNDDASNKLAKATQDIVEILDTLNGRLRIGEYEKGISNIKTISYEAMNYFARQTVDPRTEQELTTLFNEVETLVDNLTGNEIIESSYDRERRENIAEKAPHPNAFFTHEAESRQEQGPQHQASDLHNKGLDA